MTVLSFLACAKLVQWAKDLGNLVDGIRGGCHDHQTTSLCVCSQVSHIVPYKTEKRSDIMYCCTRGQRSQLMPVI